MAKYEIKDGVAIIPARTRKIKDSAYDGCTSLTTLTLPIGVNKIEEQVFDECSALAAINVPAKKTDYYKQRLHKRLHDKIVELAPEKKTKVKK